MKDSNLNKSIKANKTTELLSCLNDSYAYCLANINSNLAIQFQSIKEVQHKIIKSVNRHDYYC